MTKASTARLVGRHPKATWTDLGVLVAVGLTASWIASVVQAESAGPDFLVNFSALPPLYYYSHGLEILAVMASGLLAASRGRFRFLGFWQHIAFLVLFLTAAVWAVASYTFEELHSPLIFGATGPFVWFSLIFVLPGTDRRVWSVIDPLIRILSFATAALAVRSVVRIGESQYLVGLATPTVYTVLMMWLGGWTLLSATRLRGWRVAARALPVLVLMMTALFLQIRSWTILALLMGAAFVILRSREHGSVLGAMRTFLVVFLIVLALAGALYNTVLKNAIGGLAERAGDDTRSNQYVAFFSDVPISDLLLGRGPKGTWYWSAFFGDYQSFDNGYIWMLFIGGLPTLISYAAIVLCPAICLLGKNPRGQDAAAVCMVLFWGLAQTGLSTFSNPNAGLPSYVVSLYAGRCYLILAEKAALRAQRRIRRGRLLPSWAPSRQAAH